MFLWKKGLALSREAESETALGALEESERMRSAESQRNREGPAEQEGGSHHLSSFLAADSSPFFSSFPGPRLFTHRTTRCWKWRLWKRSNTNNQPTNPYSAGAHRPESNKLIGEALPGQMGASNIRLGSHIWGGRGWHQRELSRKHMCARKRRDEAKEIGEVNTLGRGSRQAKARKQETDLAFGSGFSSIRGCCVCVWGGHLEEEPLP